MGRAPTDRELGIRAQRSVAVDALGLEGPSRAHAERYEASPPDVLDEMLLGLDLDLPRTRFIDLGCGKGRVLCHAALRPFAEVIGIELSASLCETARDNLARLDPRDVRAAQTRVVHGDAARHRFASGAKVVYMYNPFRGPVLRRVLANLVARTRTDDAPTHVLYFEPMQRKLLEERPELEFVEEADRWAIYRIAVPSGLPPPADLPGIDG